MTAEEAFRKMRDAWFDSRLASAAHEREWESEDREKQREDDNRQMRVIYDRQTDEILAGVDRCLTPRCWNDLDT